MSSSVAKGLIVMCSKRWPLVIKFNPDSFFSPVAQYDCGPYWWGSTASAFSQLWSSMTQSVYLIWSIMEVNMWSVCVYVCVKNWSKFGSEYLKEQGLLRRTRHSWEYNIKMDLKEVGWKGVVY